MKKSHIIFLTVGLLLVWAAFHIPGMIFGTSDTPLHISYMTADEQLPVNGALHMLESRSLLGVRDSVNYYGPVFALVGVPAVIADFLYRLLSGAVSGLMSYKDFIVWNWGGILIWSRFTGVLAGFLGLVAVYLMFGTVTLNPTGKKWLPLATAILLGFNYLYFEYANFFRHWIFIVAIALWQMYLLIRMVENPEHSRRYWIWQAVLTVASFGISYFGMAYEIIWLPVLIKWIREKNWQYLKEFALFLVAIVIGMVIVVWWYPYPFERMLSVAGLIGTFTRVGAVMDITSAPASSGSFWFYLQVIVYNNFLLILSGIVLLVALWKKRVLHNTYWLWVFLLPAILNLVIFSIPAHHESRYALPTIAFGFLALAGLFGMALKEYSEKHAVIRLTSWLLGLSLILSCIQIVGWERMISAGPPERREIVPQVIAWQQSNPKVKVAVYLGWPLGYVHTHEAYVDFVTNHNKQDSDLWQYILKLSPPKDVTPINVYYRIQSTSTAATDLKSFDHVIGYKAGQLDPAVWDGSPNDQFDVKPWTVWNFAEYQQTYPILK